MNSQEQNFGWVKGFVGTKHMQETDIKNATILVFIIETRKNNVDIVHTVGGTRSQGDRAFNPQLNPSC